ncbi:MAG: hypothetical protein HKN70_10460, partial [Gammaproteobacteria bacterium]|nr:hypothetical protein [Gammaproteobacteria bacterium]
MNTLIIFQKDDDVVPLLTAHGLDMTGGMKVIGGFQTMVSEMTETASAKGPVFGDANEIYTAIVKFTTATLAAVQNDVVEIQIIFMFHQTSGTVARNIINGSRLIEWTHKLQELADDANKHLKVVNVILLSCESAADLTVQPPVRKGLVRAVNQARDMRNAVKSAYKTKQAPP